MACEPGHRLHGQFGRRQIRHRTLRAPSSDFAIDQPRIVMPQLFVRNAEPLEPAGAIAGDHYVSMMSEASDAFTPKFRLQVDHDTSFARVELQKHRTVIANSRWNLPQPITLWRFDLGNFGT